MKKVLQVTYASSLTNLCEINSSFDTGVLRICYTGKNRNGSALSRDAIEKCIPTLYNCPIVCNYDRETNELGGHDMELVRTDDGGMRIVNVTQPVGVIPESAKFWFEDYEEEDGTVHEYLYAEVLLWKRQEAYKKIKEDGITSHSMEITVKDGISRDGVFHIFDFEFTAFCLIGVEPCFESSALETFAKDGFKQEMFEMMQDLKETFAMVNTSTEDDNTYPQNSTEGGERALDKKMELVAKYGIDVDSLDFSIEDFSEEELEEKFSAMQDTENTNDAEASNTNEDDDAEQFALTEAILDEMCKSLSMEKIHDEWGEYSRYWYADSDFDLQEVYCWDCEDWNLYGFSYEQDGDLIKIDFDSKKRMKYVIAEFEDGEQESPIAPVFEMMSKKLNENADLAEKYQKISDDMSSMETELQELRQFKTDTEEAAIVNERNELFARFEDLNGNEAFEALRADCDKFDMETLEEKCFAIRGKIGMTQKFSLGNETPKMKVDRSEDTEEPYGGLFMEYGIGGSN